MSYSGAKWHLVVNSEQLTLLQFETMLVARVKDHRSMPKIIELLDRIYPWSSSLKHVKRIHRHGNDLDVLVYPCSFTERSLTEEEWQKYFQNERRTMKIPVNRCLLQEKPIGDDYWPNLLFRQSENNEMNKDLTDEDRSVVDLLEV